MSVDSKVIIQAKQKDLATIGSAINSHLNGWIIEEIKSLKEYDGFSNIPQFLFSNNEIKNQWTFGLRATETRDFEVFSTSFTIFGEHRILTMSYSDFDYTDIMKGGKVIISIGKWGKSSEIMEQVLNGLSCFPNHIVYIESESESDMEITKELNAPKVKVDYTKEITQLEKEIAILNMNLNSQYGSKGIDESRQMLISEEISKKRIKLQQLKNYKPVNWK